MQNHSTSFCFSSFSSQLPSEFFYFLLFISIPLFSSHARINIILLLFHALLPFAYIHFHFVWMSRVSGIQCMVLKSHKAIVYNSEIKSRTNLEIFWAEILQVTNFYVWWYFLSLITSFTIHIEKGSMWIANFF